MRKIYNLMQLYYKFINKSIKKESDTSDPFKYALKEYISYDIIAIEF